MIDKNIIAIIRRALKEDIGKCDITTFFSIPANLEGKTMLIAKEKGLLCGLEFAKAVFKEVNKDIVFEVCKKEGDWVKTLDIVAFVKGNMRSILMAERVAINIVSSLSGIATRTNKYIEKVKNTKVKILDTRKTTPGLRILEKYAVKVGGAQNHRFNLEDGIIIKDNHLAAGSFLHNGKLNEDKFRELIEKIRQKTKLKIEVEVESVNEFIQVSNCKPDIIMLDNFSVSNLKKAVAYRNEKYPNIQLEASGGVGLNNVVKIASTGVDFISVGEITHSAQSIDFSLEVVNEVSALRGNPYSGV